MKFWCKQMVVKLVLVNTGCLKSVYRQMSSSTAEMRELTMQTLACLVNLSSQKNKCTFFLSTSIMQILNTAFNDDNINNPSSGTMSSTWTYLTRFSLAALRMARMLISRTNIMCFSQRSPRYSKDFCGSLFISQRVKNVFALCLVAKDKQSIGMWILTAHC